MEPTWGDLDDRDFEALEADFTDVQETLEQLQSYDYDALSEEQKLTYDIISNYVELELSLEICSYSGTIFGEITGVQSNIPLNMSLYEFYAEDDVEDYLALMEQVDDYFDYCLDYELYRTEKGCGMSDTIIDNAIDQCNMFIEHTDDNYLITTFDHRIDEMDISDREKEEYKSHNREIVINTVIPAYEDMITSLNDLKGKSKDLGGICNYKGGKQYYEYIIAHKTGSAKSIEELEDILKDVWEEPGYYPQYFIGYLEFEELRDYAEEKLGDSFDEAAYHKVILETGPCDFEILRTQMDKYIDSVLGSQS